MYAILIFIFTLFSLNYAIIEPKVSKNSRIVINCILITIFSLLIAFRPLTVPDTDTYIDFYNQIEVFSLYDVNNFMVDQFDMEIGYIIFCQVVKFFFGKSTWLFLLIIPVINVSLIAYGSNRIMHHVNQEFSNYNNLRDVKYGFGLMLCLYTSYFGLMYNGIVLRAGIALSLLVCALAMYLSKKYFKMIILCFIAISFHRMALIGIMSIALFHFTPVFKFKRLYYFIAWLSIGGLALFHVSNRIIELVVNLLLMLFADIPILSPLSYYLLEYVSYSQFGYASIFFYLIGLILLLWNIESDIYYKMLNVYYVGLATLVILNNIPGASRISDYMTIYIVMALYILYMYGKAPRVLKRIVMLGVVLIGNILVLSVFQSGLRMN